MKDKEEQIKDIIIKEVATYGFIGGLTFLGVMFFVSGQEAAVLVDAILAGGAATVFSVAVSYLTIGQYFAKKRQKISQMMTAEESLEDSLPVSQKTKEEPFRVEDRSLKMEPTANLYPINNNQVMIRQRKKK